MDNPDNKEQGQDDLGRNKSAARTKSSTNDNSRWSSNQVQGPYHAGLTRNLVAMSCSKRKLSDVSIDDGKFTRSGTASAANELTLIENIADQLGSDAAQHLLFHGHEYEHTAREFFPLAPGDLRSSVDSQGHKDKEHRQSASQHPQVIDMGANGVYCLGNTSNGIIYIARRPCGHYIQVCVERDWAAYTKFVLTDNCQLCNLERQ